MLFVRPTQHLKPKLSVSLFSRDYKLEVATGRSSMKDRIRSIMERVTIDRPADSPESWHRHVGQVFNEADRFYNESGIDDLTDVRLKNKAPDFAERLHKLAIYAPADVNQELRRQVYIISKNHTEIVLLFDMNELDDGIEQNRQRDDERANEIIAEVIVEEQLHKPVRQGLDIIEQED